MLYNILRWPEGHGNGRIRMSEQMLKKENSIGVFDSGVGGVGVLKELVQLLPNENYIYFGDSLHAPYGEKTPEQVLGLVDDVVKHLLSQNVKAILIACNTATSVAAETLRRRYPDIPIIGMEPALKCAVSAERRNRVLVMATPVTLHLDKYLALQHRLEDRAEFIPVECPGLAKRIEEANLDGEDLKEMLRARLLPYRGRVDNVVLGCTHYPFVRSLVREIIGDVPILDGTHGTVLQVARVLSEKGLLNPQEKPGTILFESSKATAEELNIYRALYDLYEV